MIVVLAVVLVALGAGVVAFAVSASPATSADPIDPAVEERALVRWLDRRPRLARFLRQRFDRRTRGGFLLTASFLIVLVVGTVLGVLLEMVDEGTGLARFDESVARWGSEHATSDAVRVIEAVTHLGGTLVVVPVLAVVAAFDYARRRNPEVFAFVVAVGLGVVVLNNILKLIVDRDRPDVLQLVSAAGSSFPSGHSATAAATWSAVALILGRGQSRRVRA
ncbi:MAG: phosphatase PAP2 family protein, partial [Ilumatobacteraceae bacterium]